MIGNKAALPREPVEQSVVANNRVVEIKADEHEAASIRVRNQRLHAANIGSGRRAPAVFQVIESRVHIQQPISAAEQRFDV